MFQDVNARPTRFPAASGQQRISYNFSLDCPEDQHYNFCVRIRFTGEKLLAMSSSKSGSSKAMAAIAHALASFRLLALLPALISLLVSVPAWGDIFKWTDEQGRINISNVPPPTSAKAKNVEIVLKEASPASISQRVATSTEQALLARIESLERQLQTRQYVPQAPAVPPPTPYAGYYPATTPPPPPSGYYGSSYPSYFPSYYPSYTYPVATSYVTYPARVYATQPAFVVSRGGYSHGGGGHRGRR